MKKFTLILLSVLVIFTAGQLCAQNHPNAPHRPSTPSQHYPNNQQNHTYQPNQPPVQPGNPMPPAPPMPPIRQDFPTSGIQMNIGNLPTQGINISAESGAMAEKSSIEVTRLDPIAAIREMLTNVKNHSQRFIAVSDLYDIKTTGMNQYSALPIKYALLAKGPVPNGSRIFMLVKLGNEVYFIPTITTNTYGMVIGEINSCAIYDKIALIADTSYNTNSINSFMMSCSLDSANKPANPHYATLSDSDGFAVSAHIFPTYGRNSRFSSQTMTIIQPQTSVSLNIYKFYEKDKIFVQSIPFTAAGNYSFCSIDLGNFEKYYDNNSISYAVWLGFENTNIEDIPNALIFRTTCYDDEGIHYATEDQLVYIALPKDGFNSPFSGGNGTSANPYIITHVNQLDKVRDYKRRFFKLGCDLDIRNYQNGNWLSLGDNEEPFNGFLDGNNRTIRNLSINAANENYQGLFGCIKNGSVRNLKIQLAPEGIIGNDYCGILAGYCSNARIFQCYTTGSVKANNYIGGLVGYTTNYTSIRKSLSDCSFNSSISKTTIGGLVGYAENTTITDCHSNTNITASGENSSIGGIIAQGEQAKLQNCYSTGLLQTGRTGTSYAGGIAGYLNGSEVKGCIALNSRVCSQNQGRIAGQARSTSFIRCYAWEFIRDINNRNLSEGGFGGGEFTKEGRNGESIAKNSFYGSKTRNKFWTVNKHVGFNLNSWVFNSGYNLPQLRGMPSIANPDYLR